MMKSLFDILRKKKNLASAKEMRDWAERRYAAPSPHLIKQNCLIRNGISGATWVETGTFLGETTSLLAEHSTMVYSIEPEPKLFARAKELFAGRQNVEIINGVSEDVFPGLLPKIQGDVNFWLDGHYSAGITFKGKVDTPIGDELRSISENLSHFNRVTVLVDDVRCFDPRLEEFSTYPSIDFLVDWARTNKFSWHIEHDIFIAQNHQSTPVTD
jgi:hypothetical protein